MTALAQDRKLHGIGTLECDIPEELTILDDQNYDEFVGKPNFGVVRVMHPKYGDRRVVWNRMNLAEISAAKRMFTDLIQQGMVPYKVGTNGQPTADVMDEFDPTAQEVIFLPVKMVAAG